PRKTHNATNLTTHTHTHHIHTTHTNTHTHTQTQVNSNTATTSSSTKQKRPLCSRWRTYQERWVGKCPWKTNVIFPLEEVSSTVFSSEDISYLLSLSLSLS